MSSRRSRRGVVLLIVLSLLVVFLLLAVTFLLVSAQYLASAKAEAREGIVGDPPVKHLDMALYQVLRDSRAPSALQGHSLLRDLYGVDGVRVVVTGAAQDAGGQFLTVNFNFDPSYASSRDNKLHYYSGSLCTPIDLLGHPGADGVAGNGDDTVAPGDSVRIVAYYPSTDPAQWLPGADGAWGVAGEDDDGNGTPDDGGEFGAYGSDDVPRAGSLVVETFGGDGDFPLYPRVGGRLVLNGRPFSGAGAGYDFASGNLDVRARFVDASGNPVAFTDAPSGDAVPQPPLALLPHYAAYPTDWAATFGIRPTNGDLDEDYDAVDYQNMLLARVPAATRSSAQITPSLHRPELVRYWTTRHPTEWLALPEFRRAAVLRPMPWDHPNFSGSNAAFDPAVPIPQLSANLQTGPWDVDNDRDGVPDSIWVDPNFPLLASPDGRLYKALAAILCLDLDSRFNLNAHGNRQHVDPAFYDTVPGGAGGVGPWAGSGPGGSRLRLPRGRGFGPAEISLRPLFVAGSFTADQQYQNLLNLRYGPTDLDLLGATAPGYAQADDLLSRLRNFGTPPNYIAGVGAYASPPDVWGIDAVALDYRGQPLTAMNTYFTPPSNTENDPYELDLSQTGSQDTGIWDQPFTVAELERLLRWNDADAGRLPGRLAQAAPDTFQHADRRRLVTTESRHLPVVQAAAPREMRPLLPGQRATHLLDLYAAKLQQGGDPNNRPIPRKQVAAELARLVPWELLRGELFDLNRPLGNGWDDDANGVADEPTEAWRGYNGRDDNGDMAPDDPAEREKAWSDAQAPAAFNNTDFAHLNNDPLIGSPLYARQIYARHLYCLLTLLTDLNYLHPLTGGSQDLAGYNNSPTHRELTQQRLAQWAINVVDFRDSDGVMTPFEYDVNPWNGWQTIDGNPASNDDPGPGLPNERRLVWGAETPDLLITETLAAHNRRVKDTAHDDGSDVEAAPGKDRPQTRRLDSGGTERADRDHDQYRIPQGSLFLELYCPRTRGTVNPRLPAELYVNGNLDLGRVAPIRPDGVQQPVWRVAIAQRQDSGQPDAIARGVPGANPDTTSFETHEFFLPKLIDPNYGRAAEPVEIERLVWFAPLSPAGNPEANLVYYQRGGALAAGAGGQSLSNVIVPPGRYAVAGPRAQTYPSSLREGADADLNTCENAPQLLQLTGGDAEVGTLFSVIDQDGTDNYSPRLNVNVRKPFGLICAADPPPTWANTGATAPTGIGMNVSEPMPASGNYYGEPTHVSVAGGLTDAYCDLTAAYDGATNACPDTPFDGQAGRLGDGDATRLQTGTRVRFKHAYLQRLADPLLPWNPLPTLSNGTPDPSYRGDIPVNPYLTVDFAAIDLTVYNGDDRVTSAWTLPEAFDPPDTADPYNDAPNEKFNTRQRGAAGANLWTPLTGTPADTAEAGGFGDYHFRIQLEHTLGFLNVNTLGVAPLAAGAAAPDHLGDALAYVGDPATPFPWLAWFNRPFTSPAELMLVPASTPARLAFELGQATPDNPYDTSDPTQDVNFRAPFRHLLNFFQTTELADPNTTRAAHFYRLFDYVQVRSPNVGTDRWYNPTAFAAAASPGVADGWRPPFNRLSLFRDPGRINVNTLDLQLNAGPDGGWGVQGQDDNGDMTPDDVGEAGWPGSDDQVPWVWRGVTHASPQLDPLDPASGAIFLSYLRQSVGRVDSTSAANYPTTTVRPFRSYDAADLAPDIGVPSDTDPLRTLRYRGSEGGLLRAHPTVAQRPLVIHPVDGSLTPGLHEDADRQAYFRYQWLQKLSNLTTTHSNVYAVWITLGYFEVEPNPAGIDAAHPDGFRLGPEVGIDTGDIRRHRAFYLIDRSIPVGFEPGENLNVDRAVLLRRQIE